MSEPLSESLIWDVTRVTEATAIAAAKLRGRGDEMAADLAAVKAMRTALNDLAIDGRVVIGEGNEDEVPALFINEELGTKSGPTVDIAADPLEGTTLCAKSRPNAISVLALAEPVFKHRMALNYQARADGVTLADVLNAISSDL